MACSNYSYNYGAVRIKSEYTDDDEEGFPVASTYRKLYDVSATRHPTAILARTLKNKFMSVHRGMSQDASFHGTTPCFYTAVSIYSPAIGDRPVVVHKVFLDTGAAGNFLRRDVVEILGFPVFKTTRTVHGRYGTSDNAR